MFVQTEFNKSNNNNDLSRGAREQMADGYEELFKDLDLISRFCMPICSRDNEVREVALDVISKTVEGWLDGVGSPKHNRLSERRRLQTSSNGCACSDIVGNAVNDIPKEYLELVTLHLPIILRLSLSCPFVNVREKCQHILEIVQRRGLPVPYPLILGPSAYIDPDELPPLGTYNEKTHTLFVDAFLQNNRLDHVTQVMGYHPAYLDHFLKTQHFILRGDGPLPYDYRHYIAIMASGRHQCNYLITLQKQEFLLQGGDHTWLKGLEFIPQKLRSLYDINKILAHQPWLLNKSHIEKLTKGKDSWSLAEVVHAIVILTHFHSLCSFVFSCGVNQEVDQLGAHTYPTSDGAHAAIEVDPSNTNISKSEPKDIPIGSKKDWKYSSNLSPPSPTEPEVGITTLVQRMKTLSERNEECTPVELTKRFENVESQSAELGAVGQQPQEAPADICVFVDDPSFIYHDFAKRHDHDDIMTFRVQDYSWDDHGYSLVNRLYNDVGNLLDDKFKTAYNLTYYTMGGRTDVDTSRFRRAIWNYIQCLLGIRHDDYNYGEINQLLERSLKTFIKSACCFPERVTKKDYDRVLREFKHSEKPIKTRLKRATVPLKKQNGLKALSNSDSEGNQENVEDDEDEDDPEEIAESSSPTNRRKKWSLKECKECGKTYKTNYKLAEHMRKHTGEKPYKCGSCEKAFRSKIGLAQHEAKHTGQYDLSCPTCGKGFQCKSYLMVHQRVHSDVKPYPCTTCGRNFKTKQSLLDHTNRHLGVKPYMCDVCGRGFITKGLCKAHQKVHTGLDNRKYSCKVCNKMFVSKSYLQTHLRIHTGEKPFICEVCGKGFLTRVDLKIHTTMHTGEKSYVCEMCGKAFARRDALRCHRRSHTGERPYSCDQCGQTFTQFSPMAIHKRLHTGERPYSCEVCGQTFVSRSTMVSHSKRHVR